MRSTSLLSVLAAATAVSARIGGIAAPESIAAGSDFTITIITENYIQAVLDISAAFGLTTKVYPDSLGPYLTSVYLGPTQSNIRTNISVPASVPSSYNVGSTYHLIAAITSLYGAGHSPTTTLFDLAVTVSNATSSSLIATFDGIDSCASSTPSATTSTTASVTASTAAATSTSTSGSGSFLNINDLIQGLQTGLNSLITDILRSDTAIAEEDYNTLSPLFDQLLHFAAPSGVCSGSATSEALNESEAIQLIQTIQSTLSLVALDVINGNSVSALLDACTAQSDYLNSGLHEYVFGSGQASGTGQ
ncbi:hypothetical protein LTR91_012592 [Friedmanniomyces endolithicus]|uniref:Uncharacterized protein n=1 Tax=Friedmanniomyces endolithicus TaxID=329885 RepID=A0A4U0U3M8_9PEZI|nr:hypothetical protein LTS09_010470 [Friedmanniomyces endolithicus]KAK0365220.1 hypothetical protein LTR94_007770 [Friedmanniomyces endolithicus]KAK0793459.1 hypothetical protein LTR38_009545 [Friedmanniomyces endolithicus]KAK0801910.1 hypothetical protein LTR59_005264 [Friedmanniomyces endolithicus]KAK0847480.1 hypothetical protein LTR03_006265 [Friedmanniomyces endolithicus]